eukprot:SAG11_NODE_3007_length_2773_cov_2.200449_1_plen_35_part_10
MLSVPAQLQLSRATFTYPIKKAALKKIRGHENLHK